MKFKHVALLFLLQVRCSTAHDLVAALPAAPSSTALTTAVDALDDCAIVPWVHFTWSVREDHTMVWNHSTTCVRTVTWRSFAFSGSTWQQQFATGPGQVVVLPVARAVGDSTRVTLPHLYYGGGRPCGVTEQHDGDMGSVPDMDWLGVAFPPGMLYSAPPCAERSVPPSSAPPVQLPPVILPPPVCPGRVHGNPYPWPGAC